MGIYEAINSLTGYALSRALIEDGDVIYTKNRFLELFDLEGFESAEEAAFVPDVREDALENILGELLDYAVSHGLIGDSVTERDLFDTKIMGLVTPRPSAVSKAFWELFRESPERATSWFYKFSQDTDYIRRYRIKKDLKWKAKTAYGDLDITINLSKPEKDPVSIAAARTSKAGYPACALCKENEGYAGRGARAARQTLRYIPITLCGAKYGFQFSPYVYYNEHCIVFSYEHTPMKICGETFRRLFDFLRQFPHYTIGSNADLPIVGGSILSHDHFQGGRYEFPMERAETEERFTVRAFEDIDCAILRWPMSVIRISSAGGDTARLCLLADKILAAWQSYTDEGAFIFCETDGERHNTITPIARMRGAGAELDLVLRNNITTPGHPLGVFHPHQALHHIKKENIGLIEVMGLAVLPSRLKTELSLLEDAMLGGKDFRDDAVLGKHYDWACAVKDRHPGLSRANITEILKDETGLVFAEVLEDAGVFKRSPEGRRAFGRFISHIK